MPQSCHDSDLESIFLTEISPHEVFGMNIVPMLNPLKFSITTPLNFQNMQSVSMPVQVFWNLELIPTGGKLVLKPSIFFLPCSPLSCVSVAQISTLEGGYVSAIAKYSRTLSSTHRWVFLTSPWKTHLLPNSWDIRWNTWMIHGSDSFKPSGLSQV